MQGIPRLFRSEFQVLNTTGPGLVSRTLAENPELAKDITVLFPDDVCDERTWHQFGDFGVHAMEGSWRLQGQLPFPPAGKFVGNAGAASRLGRKPPPREVEKTGCRCDAFDRRIASMNFWKKLPKGIQWRLARWLGRRPCRIQMESPVISFTFDDFPRSALQNGGTILRKRGFVGTYYTSLGLMGQKAPVGEIFVRQDLDELLRQEHELACHTFDHCDTWDTEPSAFEASILRNQQKLAQLLPGARFTSLSYPISWPRPQTKRRVARHYECARGCGQTFNTGTVDLDYLKAFFIEQSRGDFDVIRRVIDANARAKGWLIFATHDVCDSPTRFGCTPALFEQVVGHSANSGASILPVHAAFQRLAGNCPAMPPLVLGGPNPPQRSVPAGTVEKNTDIHSHVRSTR